VPGSVGAGAKRYVGTDCPADENQCLIFFNTKPICTHTMTATLTYTVVLAAILLIRKIFTPKAQHV
jgi:hypothetical protein